jgi:catechol 2,3-dioxygenase-like lactoylglutathione lyase family enzyme
MELTIQTALLNVTDVKQSIEFYRDVFELRLVSQGDRVAALMISEEHRRQVLLLRELGRNAYHGGRGNVGVRMLSFEVGSLAELDLIEQRLTQRQALVWHGRAERYSAIIGLDPDRIEIAVSSSNLDGTPIQSEDGEKIDHTIYAIE